MNLSINTTFNEITIESSLLDLFIATPANYTSCIVTLIKDDNEAISETYTSSEPITALTNIKTVANVESMIPTFISSTTTLFTTGVYNIKVTLTDNTTINVDTGCLFVDYKESDQCNAEILKQIYNLDLEDVSTFEKMSIYRILEKSNECNCECEKVFRIYDYLISSLNKCKSC